MPLLPGAPRYGARVTFMCGKTTSTVQNRYELQVGHDYTEVNHGDTFILRIHETNTGPATLTVIGATTLLEYDILHQDKTFLLPGELEDDKTYIVMYDSMAGGYVLLTGESAINYNFNAINTFEAGESIQIDDAVIVAVSGSTLTAGSCYRSNINDTYRSKRIAVHGIALHNANVGEIVRVVTSGVVTLRTLSLIIGNTYYIGASDGQIVDHTTLISNGYIKVGVAVDTNKLFVLPKNTVRTYAQFFSSGNLVLPESVSKIYVTAIGGGGGGGGARGYDPVKAAYYSGGGGAGGHYVIRKPIEVYAGQTISITIGAGGPGGYISPAVHHGGDGGATSIGSYLTLHGGKGGWTGFYSASGSTSLFPKGGIGGTNGGNGAVTLAADDSLLFAPTAGSSLQNSAGGAMSLSFNTNKLGGGGGAGFNPGGYGGEYGENGQNGFGRGAGGGGAGGYNGSTGDIGGDGADGYCLIEWYE